jgi:hypothetical protein
MPGFADPTPEELGDFPKNIQHYYWISDGKNDEHPWRALCRLSTGLFVYITASCAFSGFACEGDIHVFGATSLQMLLEHGMAEDARPLALLASSTDPLRGLWLRPLALLASSTDPLRGLWLRPLALLASSMGLRRRQPVLVFRRSSNHNLHVKSSPNKKNKKYIFLRIISNKT